MSAGAAVPRDRRAVHCGRAHSLPVADTANLKPHSRFILEQSFPGGASGKELCLPVQQTQETQARPLGQGDPLEKERATHASILAWEPTDRGAWQATVHRVAKSWT